MHVDRVVTVVDSHTAGHPTRVLMSGIPALPGDTVEQKRDYFRKHHDDMRPLLLHEPRGHSAMVMAVPVSSRVAQYGLFFVSSYVYLDMCGHATIGYVATLAATGALHVSDGLQVTIETPAGIVEAKLDAPDGELRSISFSNVPCRMDPTELEIVDGEGRKIPVLLAFGGAWFAIVDVGHYGEPLTLDNASRWCARGALLKAQVNDVLAQRSPKLQVGSVMFVKPNVHGGKHLVVLESNKFDRSPCGTGTSARLAVLYAQGKIAVGETYRAENILGVSFEAKIVSVEDNGGVIPEISGMAHMSSFATLVLERMDPLPGGFLSS